MVAGLVHVLPSVSLQAQNCNPLNRCKQWTYSSNYLDANCFQIQTLFQNELPRKMEREWKAKFSGYDGFFYSNDALTVFTLSGIICLLWSSWEICCHRLRGKWILFLWMLKRLERENITIFYKVIVTFLHNLDIPYFKHFSIRMYQIRLLWKWRHHVPPKHGNKLSVTRCVRIQKAVIWEEQKVLTDLRMSFMILLAQ
jgi:hypothetical protein